MYNANPFRHRNTQYKKNVARATVLSAAVLISGIELLAGERNHLVLNPRSISGISTERAEAFRLIEETLATLNPLAPSEGATALAISEIGFESNEGYSLGPVHGQVGWGAISSIGPESPQPIVSSENPAGGAQHLRCDSDPNVPSDGLFSATKNLERVGPGLCVVSADVFISQVGGTWFSLEARDAELGFSGWGVNFLPDDPGEDGVPGDILVVNETSARLTTEEYVPGVYKRLRVESDDVQDTLKVFYDGVMIHSGDYPGGSLILVSVFYDNTGGSTIDIDNLTVSCAGDPVVGACCLSDGGCEPGLTRVECGEMDRVAWRPETICSANVCDGDCCLPDLSCFEDMTIIECDAVDGEYRSTNFCFSVGCGGACCVDGKSCVEDVREVDCDDLNGAYQGRGTECASAECCGVDPDEDGVMGCSDVCPNAGTFGEVDTDGRPLGDVDHNCAVDLQDHAIMQRNFTGPVAP
jgi:hypothetical protein